MARRLRPLPILVLLTVLAGASAAAAADADQPHDHRGKLAPFSVDTVITLDEGQLARLAKGKPVLMAVPGASGGRGVAVIDIAAPPDTVWSRITAFDRYPEWVGIVKECDVYRRDGNEVFTRVKASNLLFSYEYFLHNTLDRAAGVLSWTLDYDRRSDFDDCVGAWVVEDHPERAGWTRAWFGSDLLLRDKLPGFLAGFARDQGLKDATGWVRKQSQKAMEKD